MQNSRPLQPQYAGVGNSKVAIPKLQRHEDPKLALGEKLRVLKACTNCRKRKVKCTGELPQCKKCEEAGFTCTYEQARKDRLKSATKQNHVLISLLKDLSLRVNKEDQGKIDATLEAINDQAATPAAPRSTEALSERARKESLSDEERGESHDSGEAHAPASVGSNEDLDLLDEDLLRNREAKETGFVGQISEVQWLRSLQRGIESTDSERYQGPYGSPGDNNEAATNRIDAMHERRNSGKILHVADSNFYLDSESIEVEAMVDPYELPPFKTAEKLFACYMESAHSWLPILPQEFEGQFRKYYEAINIQRRFEVPDKWLAVLNLVFAIGAQYSLLTRLSSRADELDHLLYMTRAVRILGLKDITLIISAPDLLWIQATGLLSFYYMIIGHVSKAWGMVGISVRSALAVGLHLRNEDPSASLDKKEIFMQTWWSLYSLECLLSAITGRPFVIANEDCTVPLPHQEEHSCGIASSRGQSNNHNGYPKPAENSPTIRNVTTESSNSTAALPIAESFLDAYIKIGLITRSVLKKLYSARTANASWEHTQKIIKSLMRELDEWETAALPNKSISPYLNSTLIAQRERLLLEFHYNSTKILITRPCLCRLERRIKNQSDSSVNFNQQTAEACVQAAQSLTRLLPDQPDPVYIYQNGPWWSIVHNIMQAMVVLLLELSYGGSHMTTQDNEDIPKCIKKLIRWLRSMRSDNGVADRAYKVVINILKSGKLRVQDHTANILSEDEAGIDHGHLFQAYLASTHATDSRNAFARGEWQAEYYPDPTGNFDPIPDAYFLPDQFQMPEVYDNLFLTDFDQPNPFFSMDGLLMDEGEASL